jgi:hypothetical protein
MRTALAARIVAAFDAHGLRPIPLSYADGNGGHCAVDALSFSAGRVATATPPGMTWEQSMCVARGWDSVFRPGKVITKGRCCCGQGDACEFVAAGRDAAIEMQSRPATSTDEA